MGKTTQQLKQMEALFVPRKGSIEFAGVVEASRDANCDIHGRRGSAGSIKRDSISHNNGSTKRDSVDQQSSSEPSYLSLYTVLGKRDSVPCEPSYLSSYTVLGKGESIDKEFGNNDNGDNLYSGVQRRRSSGGKNNDTNR